MKNFVVYKSSAGSGKTHTLVREYLALALAAPYAFRHILAITFTNKAANEMKQRVLQSLSHLSDPGNFPETSTVKFMWDELVQKTGLSREEITGRASEVLTTIIHHYDDFSIRTIDSFVSRIIRTFAHDLKLPADFKIELDKDLLLDEAIDQLIRKAGIDPEITRILIEFTEAKADEEKSWHLEGDFRQVGNHLFEEDGFSHTDDLRLISPGMILEIVKKIQAHRTRFENALREEAGKAVSLIEGSGIHPDSFYYGKQGIGYYFMNLAGGKIELPNSRVTTTIENDSWVAGKAEVSQKLLIEGVSNELKEVFLRCEKMLREGFSGYLLLQLVSRQLFQLGVVSGLSNELDLIRREQRLIHVSEFNRYITGIILKEPVPFIYERVGEKFRHYLLDEFQDTSELQWKNLLPLISDSLAQGHFNLVVGDGKQAIYRFRNGQVEQFMLLPYLPAHFERSVFSEAESALRNNSDEKLLDTNFRSRSNIIAFNNDFFRFTSRQLSPDYQSIYEALEQKSLPGKTGGIVRVEFLEEAPDGSFLDSVLTNVMEIINNCISGGLAWSDIAILTRTNIQGNQVAKYLISRGVGVISAEALLLSSAAEINLLISALSFLNDGEDPVSAASLLIHLHLLGLIELPVEDTGAIVTRHHVVETLNNLGIAFDPDRLRTMPLYDLCEELIRILHLNDRADNAYIQFFLEFVNKSTAGEVFRLKDLLDKWEEKKTKLSVIVPEGVNSVRIMTVHKAKGLEFPVVILPFATDPLRNTKDQAWIKPEHEALEGLPVALIDIGKDIMNAGYEEIYTQEKDKSLLDLLNLVYVAFTRPCDQLYILTRHSGDSKTESVSLTSMLKDYMASSGFSWKKEGNTFILGEAPLVEKPTAPRTAAVFSGTPGASGWQDRITIARHAPAGWSVFADGQPYEWGNLVHETLANLSTRNDLEPLLVNLKTRLGLENETIDKLRNQVGEVVDHPLLTRAFAPDAMVFPEKEILSPGGELIRPDRIAVSEDEILVIEFKTGQPREEHVFQVGKYADALKEMYGRNVKPLLVYIESRVDVMEV